MTKAKYMALEDFQTLWDEKMKPAIPKIAGTAGYATEQTCEAAADEIAFVPEPAQETDEQQEPAGGEE